MFHIKKHTDIYVCILKPFVNNNNMLILNFSLKIFFLFFFKKKQNNYLLNIFICSLKNHLHEIMFLIYQVKLN